MPLWVKIERTPTYRFHRPVLGKGCPLGAVQQVQRLRKKEIHCKGGGGVFEPCLTFIDVSETLILQKVQYWY